MLQILALLGCLAAAFAGAPPAEAGSNEWIPLKKPLAAGTRSSELGVRAVTYALSELGRPYVWGGAGPRSFDCSGLVVWSYGRAGRGGLGHYTGWLWNAGPHVSRGNLKAGDLVFFSGGEHVGIYLFDGLFIQAPHTGDVVKISSLSGSYAARFSGAVRILPKVPRPHGGRAHPARALWAIDRLAHHRHRKHAHHRRHHHGHHRHHHHRRAHPHRPKPRLVRLASRHR